MTNELIRLTATEAVSRLRSKDVSPLEMVQASIRRIETVDDGKINALPFHCFEQALAKAKSLNVDAHRENPKSLCGLPVAIKDYNDLANTVTSYGSPIFADNVAKQSDATVKQLESNGAIAVAKSNVPEWAGGHTFNPVYGTTRNPWDLSKSAGLRLHSTALSDYARALAVFPEVHDYLRWIRFGSRGQWPETSKT